MAKPIPKALQQKIAQSQLGSGPSLVPQAPAPKEPEEVTPTLDALIGEPDDLATLVQLVQAVVGPQAEMKRLEKIVTNYKDRIKILVGQYGIDRAVCGEIKLSYYPTTRSTINAVKLIAAGVDPEVITACTDVSTSHTLKVG